MRRDPIVEEVRQHREQRARRFGYDPEKIAEDVRKREKTGDWEVVSPPPKPAAV